MNKMNFDDFKNYVVENIGEYLTDDYLGADMSISNVTRSNGYSYDALAIRKAEDADSGIVPVLDMNAAFREYEEGMPVDDCMKTLAHIRMDAPIPDGVNRNSLMSFDSTKALVFPRLVNFANNAEYLKDKPYKQVEDLAVLYAVRVHSDSDGFGEAVIDNRLMELWGVDEEQIHATALENLSNQEPVFINLETAMFDVLGNEDNPKFDLENMDASDYSVPFFLLSNRQKVSGAVMALNAKVMNRITEKFGDVYVIPSSIHEVLVVPQSFGIDPDELAEMVRSVNNEAVEPHDRLSDNVYSYDADNQTLTVVSGEQVEGEKAEIEMK